ncbi:hypothetical protein XH87_10570 [Bradyrhizobium sp. CCBAU 53415]|nr:hypothetical protein [Bradyrhizobium sp. CCBAU 53415]
MEATGQNHRGALAAAVALVEHGSHGSSVEDLSKSGRTGTSIATTRLCAAGRPKQTGQSSRPLADQK